jgi:hypothetical protein
VYVLGHSTVQWFVVNGEISGLGGWSESWNRCCAIWVAKYRHVKLKIGRGICDVLNECSVYSEKKQTFAARRKIGTDGGTNGLWETEGRVCLIRKPLMGLWPLHCQCCGKNISLKSARNFHDPCGVSNAFPFQKASDVCLYTVYMKFENLWPSLWSNGQNPWLKVQRSRVRFPVLSYFLRSSGSGKGSTQPR